MHIEPEVVADVVWEQRLDSVVCHVEAEILEPVVELGGCNVMQFVERQLSIDTA